jgi:ferritin
MLNKKVQDVINKQINAELSASYSYLAMSAWCDSANFTGAAKWFRMQSQEEYAHAMRLFDFVLARGGQVTLAELKAPRGSYKSLTEVFETAYAQEQTVTGQINNLYDVAFQAKAFDAVVQAEWFVNEQVEEEKTMREIVAQLHMIDDDPPSLLDFDRELGARQPEADESGSEAE